MRTTLIIAALMIAVAITNTCKGGDIVTAAESSQRPLPVPEAIVKIEKDTIRLYSIEGDLDKPLAWLTTKNPLPRDKNILRKVVLQFLLDYAESYHEHAIFAIVSDEYYMPESAGLYYKAYVKHFYPPDDAAAVSPPNG